MKFENLNKGHHGHRIRVFGVKQNCGSLKKLLTPSVESIGLQQVPANKKRTYKKLQAAMREDIFFFIRNSTACLFSSFLHMRKMEHFLFKTIQTFLRSVFFFNCIFVKALPYTAKLQLNKFTKMIF